MTMDADAAKMSPVSVAFALAAAITVIFNTILACAKDAYGPLKTFMASLSDQDWTTQGLADVILFVGLGLIILKTGAAQTLNSNRVISLLVGSVVIAGVGLFTWYALH
jgi:hypothetical protein